MLHKSPLAVILACILAQVSLCATTQIAFSANFKSILVEKYSVNIAEQVAFTNSSLTTQTAPTTVLIPYPATVYNTNVLADVIIGDIQTVNIKDGISVTAYLLSANNTHMAINIFSSKPSNIKKIAITYAIFSNNINVFGNVAVYHVTFVINQTISSNPATTYSTNLALPTTINTTGGASVCVLLGGIDVYPVDPSTATIDFTNEGVLTDKSTLKLTISSKSATPTYILSFTYIAILYNSGFLFSNVSTFVHLWNGVIQFPSTGSYTYSNPAFEITGFNTYIGILSLSVSNQNSFDFSTTITNNSFTIASTTSFNYATFSYFLIYTNYCGYKTPYLYTTTQLCYDVCPSSTISNEATLECSWQNSIVGNDSSPSFPIWAIVILVVIPILIIVTIMLLVKFCCNKPPESVTTKKNDVFTIVFKKNDNENKYRQYLQNIQSNQRIEDLAQPSYSKSITIDQSSKPNDSGKYEKERMLQQQYAPESGKPIESPRVQDPRYYSQKFPSTAKHETKQEWIEDLGQHQKNCCICSTQRPFLRSSCNHEFHLTCLLDWRKKSIECPLCRKNIEANAKFYCKSCGEHYKIIDLDKADPKSTTFRVVCNHCPI